MKISILVPLGDLSKYGYANVFAECLQSMVEFADNVILYQSYHDATVHGFIDKYKSVRVITGKANPADYLNWQEIDDGLYKAKIMAVGYYEADVVIYMGSDWYIPRSSFQSLYDVCEIMGDWAWLYKGNQLASRTFSASKRLPAIVRTNEANICSYTPSRDRLVTPDGAYYSERGDFQAFNKQMIVDVPFEYTLEDLEGKMNAKRCYADLLPKRKPVFDWDFWKRYYVKRMQDWQSIGIWPDPYGYAISDKSQPDYLSHYFLKELNYAPA